MSLDSAQQFVSKMKDDKEFRTTVQRTADTTALNAYLRTSGFKFNQGELVGAMAECMTELDAVT